MLFNDSIMYNIRYGSFDATDEQVKAAAEAARAGAESVATGEPLADWEKDLLGAAATEVVAEAPATTDESAGA